MTTINDLSIGTRVIAPADSDDVGIVRSLDHEGNIAYVAFPVPGGALDVVDIDPADLEVVK